ncbi:MAG: DUF5683 domain-containing protein, partial [Gemmatimonadota bacterium]|nr:DUF5683 domain-containing protein [Gemmatimonadota bacterium]
SGPMTFALPRWLAPLLLTAALAGPLAAQTTPDTVRAASPRPEADTARARYRISPRGAFVRSLVLPGWGQSVVGAPGRGAVYFGLEAGSLWMLYKSRQKLSAVREREAAEREGGTLPADRSLGRVESREEQVEDWLTLSIFWLFFSAADAFVAAHLADFDEHIRLGPVEGGGAGVQASIRVGGKP